MKKHRLVSSCLLIFLIVAPAALLNCWDFARAQSIYTSTVISSDTNWTAAGSPYDITGNVLIYTGATLTLETGTTVNLNGYILVSGSLIIQPGVTINIVNASGYIQVDGVLSALGTSTQPIQINGVEGQTSYPYPFNSTYYPSMTFSLDSTGWNQQTSSGSTLQNTVLTSITLSVSSSVWLSNDNFNMGLSLEGNSPVVTDSKIELGLGVHGGSPIVAGNTISGGVWINSDAYASWKTTCIENNVISGNPAEGLNGIDVLETAGLGTIIIERNTINTGTSTLDGIDFANPNNVQCNVLVENNTITNNAVGIDLRWGYPEVISGNNIYSNTLNVKLVNNHNFNCSNNWWGTTDPTAIGNSIHDFKNDFTLGTITFEPFLTTPNPEAAPNPNLPVPSPSDTPIPYVRFPNNSTLPSQTILPIQPTNSTATAPAPTIGQNQRTLNFTQQELLAVIAVLLAMIAGFAVATIVLVRRTRSIKEGRQH
jgi:hypothetical protein